MLAMLQLQAEMSSVWSRSSGSSTSSRSSTFSDTNCSTSATSSSPPHSKTNAFFASPFSTRPPTPDLQQTPQLSASRRAESKTLSPTDFFATPMEFESSSPPPSSSKTSSKNLLHFTSRIFPSRYTSTTRRSPEFPHLNKESHYIHLHDHDAVLLGDSDSSFSSALENNTRLPTPPPPPLVLHTDIQRFPSENIDQSTPRPPHIEPSRPSLLITRATPEHTLTYEMGKDDPEVDELQTGSVISIPLLNTALASSPLPSPQFHTFTINPPSSAPDWDCASPTSKSSTHASIRPSPSTLSLASLSSLSSGSSKITTNTNLSQSPSGISVLKSIAVSCPTFVMDSDTSSTALRILRCLGHGAFSSVWLAEDLSHVPLTLLSKKSVKYLRRRESGRGRTKVVDNKATESTITNAQSDQCTPELNKRPPSRLREGLRNMLSFSRSGSFTFTSPSSTARSPNPVMVVSSPANFDPLSRHPTLPFNHSYLSSRLSSNDDLSGMSTLPSIPPSSQSFSSNLTASSSDVNSHLTIEGCGTNAIAGSLSRDSSLRKFRARVSGTRPGLRLGPGKVYLDERDGEMGEPVKPSGSVVDEFGFLQVGEEGRLSRQSSLGKPTAKNREKDDRLVAVKVTPRRVQGIGLKNGNGCANTKEEEERTRVRFVREVEVLKHISHPNITPLLAHLSTPTDHILVLPYLPGGDLLNLVNNDVAWGKLGEILLRRMWYELCKAVGWMHGVGLVHRDIKLENILLTTTAFTSLTPDSPPPNPSPFSPLIKLTDFGLSRFVDLDEITGEAELLTTRCGSEAYAAPELVIGGRGGYDARKTDAWACGVVLYALVGRKLPFGEGVEAEGDAIGGESGVRNGWAASASLAERKHWLMRIARGDWVWPGDEMGGNESNSNVIGVDPEEEEFVGCTLIKSQGARRVVEKLLVRDPRKRARIVDLWEDEWMFGGGIGIGGWWGEKEWCRVKGEQKKEPSLVDRRSMPLREKSPSPPVVHDSAFDSQQGQGCRPVWIYNDGADGNFQEEPCTDGDCESIEGEEEEEGGCLFDQEGIDSITRQEVL